MKILLLSPYPEKLLPIFIAAGDEVVVCDIKEWPEGFFDYIISFGYRHIIKEPRLSQYKGRMINIHIGIVGNRGTHPVFWAAFHGWQQGFTIHLIDGGIDTGPVLWEQRVPLQGGFTLYQARLSLLGQATAAFAAIWEHRMLHISIAMEQVPTRLMVHRTNDITPYFNCLPKQWQSTLGEVRNLGEEMCETI